MSGDAVVIGAGLGGLAAAVALADKGLPVTLLEKEPHPGGYAIAFRRQGFTFDLSLHVTAEGGPGREFRRILEGLGLGERVSFVRLRQGFDVRLGGYRFRLPNDPDGLFDLLGREFPAERDGLARFRRDLERQAGVYAPLFDLSVSKWRSVPPFLPKLPAFLSLSYLPTSRYLERFFRDRTLMALIYQPAVFMGVPMDEFPAINFILMFHILVGGGMYTIAGGGQALTDALAGRLGELGGEFVPRAEAQKILVEGGRVAGVRTADGQTRPAATVIPAVNLRETVHRLVGDSHFPKSYLKRLAALQPSLSVQVLNLGLDCPPAEAGVEEHISIVFPDEDLDACFRRQSREGGIGGFSVTAHSNTEPSPAPPERWTLSVVAGTSPGRWLDVGEEEYREAKRRAAGEMLAAVGRVFPGVPAHVKVSDLATPRTMRRYTGNPGGAIMGFACPRGGHRDLLAVSRIPVGGLYPAGAWTDRLGGYLQAVKSGLAAAAGAERRLRS